MAVNDGTLNGWPFVNHAMELRGSNNERGSGRSTIIYPRRKYTYLVEFQINPYALIQDQMQTNMLDYLKNGRLYASLKNIDHPKINYKVETLRSYNKYVKVPTMAEFPPASMAFHDDNASIVMALWKEYDAFYRYGADVGRGSVITNNPQSNQNNEFRSGNTLTGETVRTGMETRPSVGMNLRPNTKRHFFDNIVIYDLGSDGASINIYTYVNPVITNFDHENLDFMNRSDQVSVTFNFEYENYYYILGQNASNINEIIRAYLGVAADGPAANADGHTIMNIPDQNVAYPVDEFSTSASPLNAKSTDVVAQSDSLSLFPNSPEIEVEELSPLANTSVTGSGAPTGQQLSFLNPPDIETAQTRLDLVSKTLDSATNSVVNTGKEIVSDAGRRGLALYESVLSEVVDNFNQERAKGVNNNITNSSTMDAAKKTEDAFK